MSITKKFNSYFPIIFNYSIGRIFNHLMVLILMFAQYEISTTGDEYLINAILIAVAIASALSLSITIFMNNYKELKLQNI